VGQEPIKKSALVPSQPHSNRAAEGGLNVLHWPSRVGELSRGLHGREEMACLAQEMVRVNCGVPCQAADANPANLERSKFGQGYFWPDRSRMVQSARPWRRRTGT